MVKEDGYGGGGNMEIYGKYFIVEFIKIYLLVYSDDFVIILDLFIMRWYYL